MAGTATPVQGVAAFDLDGTLTRGDTLLPFLRMLCGNRAVVRAAAAGAPALALAAARIGDRDRAKASLLGRLLAGRLVEEVEPVVVAYVDHVVAARLRSDTVARVAWHQERGHTLVVVSASPELYVDPVARRLGFDAALATPLEVDEEGRLTGRLAGPNVRAAEKVRRLRAHLGGTPSRLWAYGNSRDDAALLAAADEAMLVTRRGLVPVVRRARRSHTR